MTDENITPLSENIEFTESHVLTDAKEFTHIALREEVIRVNLIKQAIKNFCEELESKKREIPFKWKLKRMKNFHNGTDEMISLDDFNEAKLKHFGEGMV